jgi:serine phosphatase RsbU (regulator of sigma subunit)
VALYARMLLLLFFCLMTVGVAPAALPALEQTATADDVSLNGRLEIFEDPTNKSDINDVSALSFRGFKPHKGRSSPALGYTRSTIWLRIKLDAQAPGPSQRLLEIKTPMLDFVSLYHVVAGKVATQVDTGRMKRFSQRPVDNTNFVFPLTIPNKETSTIYLRVSSSSSISLPLKLYLTEAFYRASESDQLVHGLYYGIIAVMFLYNLFLFISTRDSVYGHYSAFVFVFIIYQMCIQGHAYEYLWPDSPRWNKRVVLVSLNLALLFGARMAMEFLQTSVNSPRIHKALAIVCWISVGATPIIFMADYHLLVRWYLPLLPLNLVLALAAGFSSWRSGYKPARFYIISWGVFLVLSLVEYLRGHGIVPANVVTTNGARIGSASEMCLLAFSLADRIAILREEKDSAMRLFREQRERSIKAVVDGKENLNQALRLILGNTRTLASSIEQTALFQEAIRFLLDNVPALRGTTASINIYAREKALNLPGAGSQFDAGTETMLEQTILCAEGRISSPLSSHIIPIASAHDTGINRLFDGEESSFNFSFLHVVPLLWHGDKVGYLEFNGLTTTEFGDRDSLIVDSVASSLAISLENLRFVAATKERGKIEAELEAARSIQQTLLPESRENIPFLEWSAIYRSADQTGGDWFFQFYCQTTHRAYFCVVDVNGHGVSSALIMGVVCGVFHSVFGSLSDDERRLPLGDVVALVATRINDWILPTCLRAGKAFTMVALAIDLRVGKAICLNSGHPTALLRPVSGPIIAIRGPSDLMGMFSSPNFAIVDVPIKSGDLILLYTDGLTDNEGSAGGSLKSRGLRKHLQAYGHRSDYLAELEREIDALWQGASVNDDTTAVCVRWRGQGF